MLDTSSLGFKTIGQKALSIQKLTEPQKEQTKIFRISAKANGVTGDRNNCSTVGLSRAVFSRWAADHRCYTNGASANRLAASVCWIQCIYSQIVIY